MSAGSGNHVSLRSRGRWASFSLAAVAQAVAEFTVPGDSGVWAFTALSRLARSVAWGIDVQRRAVWRQEEGVDPETRFRAVFDLAYAPLCRYARHRGLSEADAEDLVAQTLEVAWRRIEDVPTAEPLPWLYAVAHNLWRNQVRRDRRWRDLAARFRPATPVMAGADAEVLGPDVLRAALASLSEGDQEVLRLVAWDGLTPAEAAVVLGCSPLAARSRLHRARTRLADRLGISPAAQRRAPAGHKQGDSLDQMEMP